MMIVDPYRFAASGPLGDITIAVQDFTTGTATGSFDYTSSTITGLTPDAALIIGALHDPANDPGETAGASWVFGLASSASGNFLRGRSRTALANSQVTCELGTTPDIELTPNASLPAEKAASTSVISGGINLNYTTNTSPSRRFYYVAFAGPDMSAFQGTAVLNTDTSAEDITAPGFEPDAVIGLYSSYTLDSSSSPLVLSFGIATNDGTQRCVTYSETTVVTPSRPFMSLLNDSIGALISDTTGALTHKLTAGDFDASGFSITRSASFGTASGFGYLALNFGGRQFKLVDFTTPTSTGNSTITGTGFTPSFALAVLTNLETLNDFPGSTSDNMSGFSICSIGSDEQWAASYRIDSGAATTSTASQVKAAAIMGASATDCDAILGSFVAWTSDGVTINYSAVQGTGKKGFILFVE